MYTHLHWKNTNWITST